MTDYKYIAGFSSKACKYVLSMFKDTSPYFFLATYSQIFLSSISEAYDVLPGGIPPNFSTDRKYCHWAWARVPGEYPYHYITNQVDELFNKPTVNIGLMVSMVVEKTFPEGGPDPMFSFGSVLEESRLIYAGDQAVFLGGDIKIGFNCDYV